MNDTGKQNSREKNPPVLVVTRVILIQLLLIVLGAMVLMWPAFVNGYPLVFQDSAWYLNPFSGTGVQHPGRTIGYSIFTSLALHIPSLWSIVAAQALVTSALIVRVSVVAARKPRDRIIFPVAAMLAVLLLSGVAKYASWIMADMLTSWLFLAGALWMLSSRPVDRIFAVAVASLSVLAHNSHVPIVITMAFLLVAGVLLFVPPAHAARKSAVTLFIISLLSVPWVMGVNTALGSSSGVFRGTGSFLMYRFIDTGVIIPTLDRYCGERDWKSCKYRDKFAMHGGQADGWFLFRDSSPFSSELGGWGGEEQDEIIVYAFRCCWDQIALTTMIGTWQQFWRIDSSDGIAPIDTKPTYSFLKKHLIHEVPQLENSRQIHGGPVYTTLHPAPEAALHALLILVAGLLAVRGWKTGRREVALLPASVMLFLLVNAFVCSFGSSTHDRYQGRVAWLLPFAIVISAGWLTEDRNT